MVYIIFKKINQVKTFIPFEMENLNEFFKNF